MAETEKRRVRAFPKPKYHELLKAYTLHSDLTESKAICEMIKKFFDDMPEREIDRIINNYRFIVNENKSGPLSKHVEGF